jgi:diguanylate cyclase (GGDEF)-like protein
MGPERYGFHNPEEQYIYNVSYTMGKLTGSLIGRIILLEDNLKHTTEITHRDHTTKLLNTAAIEYRGSEWIRDNKPFLAIFYDLLNFKKINDLHGHANGNQYLQDIGDILVQVTKKEDFVARIGGDEFLLLLDIEHATKDPKDIARTVMERTNRYVNGYNSINYPDLQNLGISGGYAIYDPDMHPTIDSVISEADISMSLNKQQQHRDNGGAYRV